MVATKTFSSYASKLAEAIALIEQQTDKNSKKALTILRKVKESADKRSGSADGEKKAGPKRPLNNYMKWSALERPKLKAEHPEMSIIEMSKVLGKRWNEVKDSWVPVDGASPAKKASPAKAKKSPAAKKAAPKKPAVKSAKKGKAVESADEE